MQYEVKMMLPSRSIARVSPTDQAHITIDYIINLNSICCFCPVSQRTILLQRNVLKVRKDWPQFEIDTNEMIQMNRWQPQIWK